MTLNTWQQHTYLAFSGAGSYLAPLRKRLAVLGFAFKANTNDTREAPAIRICRDLLEEGAQLAIHDPKVDSETMARALRISSTEVPDPSTGPSQECLSGKGAWWKSCDVPSTVAGADAVLILTEWNQYRHLDWMLLAPLLRQPAWIFDARSVVDPSAVIAAGLHLYVLVIK